MLRFDQVTLRSPRRLKGGQLVCDAYIARTGVQSYMNPDGSERLEYRPPEEVFHADALASFEAAVVCDDHPAEPITAENARKYAVGTIQGTPRRDGDMLAATLVIFDADAIRRIEGGKRELSAGYVCDVEETPGETEDGQRYDCVQRHIRADHLAIVDVARCGPSCSIRTDAAREDCATCAPVIDDQKSRADGLEAELLQARIAIEELKSEIASMTASGYRSDADIRRDVAERVRERVAIEIPATRVLRRDVAGMSDTEIMTAVITQAGDEVPQGASPEAMRVLFSSAIKRLDEAEESFAQARTIAAFGRRVDAEERAKIEAEEEYKRRWAKAAGVEK